LLSIAGHDDLVVMELMIELVVMELVVMILCDLEATPMAYP
jgi:hypothetical protein